MLRKMITIDEEKCDGCGACIPDCPEGALQLIDGKARLVSDLFCDGLGACVGTCPRGAMTIEEREAVPYDEKRVMENIVRQGDGVIRAHLEHLEEHGEDGLLAEAREFLVEQGIAEPGPVKPVLYQHQHADGAACPGSAAMTLDRPAGTGCDCGPSAQQGSELRQWPVQLKLLNPMAPYFDNADLLLAADCTAFAHGDFHNRFMKDRIVIMFCPKLDPYIDEYTEKLTAILANHTIRSITVARMEVPCCGGIGMILEKALAESGKSFMVRENIITVTGDIA